MLLFLLFFLIVFSVQDLKCEKYRIFLKDKGITHFNLNSPEFKTALNSISEKSIFRRSKVLSLESIVSLEDLPIPENYLKQIENSGAKILLRLKWLNYVVVEANQDQLNKISKLEFVKSIQPISEIVPKIYTENINITPYKYNTSKLLFVTEEFNQRYGESINQLKMLSIDQLHSLGILGDSVILGIIDTGFRWKENSVFRQANVLKEYDFISQDNITENEPSDTTIQDHHGTMVFSIISGIKEGFLFGSAPFASFVLAKTEDIRKETHYEEDCFAAAIEWMDSIGVDIITSSLGYSKFDSAETSYSFEHFDGKTALVSVYANRAKKIGIIMVSSAGNRGPNDSTIQAPAEALGEIAIGAVNPTGDTVLKFSSRGPTYDGRLKPDFVAQGNYVICSPAYPLDTTTYGSGTSVAAPIFAGGLALLLSTFEELTPDDVYELLLENSSHKNNPDNAWGYGIPNFYNAAENYNIIISPPFTFPHSGKQRVLFKIKYKYPIEYAKIFFRRQSESTYNSEYLNPIYSHDLYFFDLAYNNTDSVFYCFVIAKASNGEIRRKPFFETKEFKIKISDYSKNLFVLPETFILDSEITFADKTTINIFPQVLTDNNEFFVEVNDFIGQRIQIQIFNIIGEKLDEFNFDNVYSKSASFRFTLKNVASGTLVVKIITSSGFAKIQKLLKVF